MEEKEKKKTVVWKHIDRLRGDSAPSTSSEPSSWSGRQSDDLSVEEQRRFEDAAERRMDLIWSGKLHR